MNNFEYETSLLIRSPLYLHSLFFIHCAWQSLKSASVPTYPPTPNFWKASLFFAPQFLLVDGSPIDQLLKIHWSDLLAVYSRSLSLCLTLLLQKCMHIYVNIAVIFDIQNIFGDFEQIKNIMNELKSISWNIKNVIK